MTKHTYEGTRDAALDALVNLLSDPSGQVQLQAATLLLSIADTLPLKDDEVGDD